MAGGRRKDTDKWTISTQDQNDSSAKWIAKPGGGWRTQPGSARNNPTNWLEDWTRDMLEWGQMMHESVLELRERVSKLEKRAK